MWQLLWWGFALREQVAPVVAKHAAAILGRTDSEGRPLSAERIEQIYEAWAALEPSGWKDSKRPGGVMLGARKPVGTRKEWRESKRPPGTVSQLAEALLREEGRHSWGGLPYGVGDAPMTAGAAVDYERIRPRFHGDNTESEDEKSGN